MTSNYGFLFWTFFLLFSELNFISLAQKSNFDKMMVKPLESKNPSRETNSAVALFQVDKIANRTALASDTDVKSNPITSPADNISEEDESNEKVLNKVGKSRTEKNNKKLSDKDLLDNIADLILKRSKNKDSGLVDTKYMDFVKDNIKVHRHPSIDFDFGNNHLHAENEESKLYAMRLPVKTIETPDDGILGKLHFRFVPINKNERLSVRDKYRSRH